MARYQQSASLIINCLFVSAQIKTQMHNKTRGYVTEVKMRPNIQTDQEKLVFKPVKPDIKPVKQVTQLDQPVIKQVTKLIFKVDKLVFKQAKAVSKLVIKPKQDISLGKSSIQDMHWDNPGIRAIREIRPPMLEVLESSP